jgi:hypothetical protein
MITPRAVPAVTIPTAVAIDIASIIICVINAGAFINITIVAE